MPHRINLKPLSFLEIKKFQADFEKHSQSFESPPETAEYLGIYEQEGLIGYFITQGYRHEILEINQGYLIKEARQRKLPSICVNLLCQLAKKAGYKKVMLCTHNRFKSYIKFMSYMGFKPVKLIFSKDLI